MRVLVTGAGGFLGVSVVQQLLDAGHEVTAMVRPAGGSDRLKWRERVRLYRADLRTTRNLESAFDGVDVLVHLAACVVGDEDTQFASTVVGTERLLEAMSRTATRRLVLASSFSVYDWSDIGRTVSESSPIEADIYARDGYAVAKVWQERLVVEAARQYGWDLVVLRPGFIWGPGHEDVPGAGHRVGPLYVAFGPLRKLALTHVENCAAAFVAAAVDSRATGKTFNVVDPECVSVWRFLGDTLGASGRKVTRLPAPYRLGFWLVRLANCVGRWVFGRTAKFPSIFVPCRFEARFSPARADCRQLQDVLDWRPPLSYREALAHTFGTRTDSPVTHGEPVAVQ